MKVVATIEARMTSSRLPGKPMMLVAGKTMLEHLVTRLKRASSIDQIVLATTVNSADDVLDELAGSLDIAVFRGDEQNVLSRVIGAAGSLEADVIVEITGDCPLIDPEIVDQVIRIYKANQADYVSNVVVRSYADGMDVQVFSLETLHRSAEVTVDPLDLEHVTLHIRNNPGLFSHIHVLAPPSLHWPELGLTLDEKADFDLLENIIEHFDSSKPEFSCSDVLDYLRLNPDLVGLNAAVVRKDNT